jgi:hypothetical protein
MELSQGLPLARQVSYFYSFVFVVKVIVKLIRKGMHFQQIGSGLSLERE